MTQVISNDVSAITPELWSSMVQVPLYKSLVALEVSNMRLSDELKYADTIHVPRFGDLSAQVYTRGTTLSATAQDWAYDTLVVSSYIHCTFYVDQVHQLQNNVEVARELAGEAAYQLKNKIDSDTFLNITGDSGFSPEDGETLVGGSAGDPVSAGSANIINLFAGARKVLRDRNVEEVGDWCAVLTPKVASYVEIKATSVGYNVADATLRNGYAGDFMGFQVYISNNLPTGECSTIASAITAAGAVSGNCRALYFGRKGTIDVVMQRAPALEIKSISDRIGSNYITWTVYGSNVFTKNKSRGINVAVGSAFA